jgi:hypothetical protein
MKTTRSLFVYNHVNKTIVASKASLKKAGRPNTAESDLLASMMREHPDYAVVEKEIKTNSAKNAYDGLTMDLMKAYIGIQKNAKEMLEVYERVVEMAIKQHKKYPLTKSWFVGVYKDFDVKKAQEAIDAYLIAQAAAAPVAASAQ